MPVVITKAIHDTKYVENTMEYSKNKEKTRISNNDKNEVVLEAISSDQLSNTLTYAANPVKTVIDEGGRDQLVNGYRCNPATAILEFEALKDSYQFSHGIEQVRKGMNKEGQLVDKKAVVAYHIVQSFPKDYPINPRLANQIGMELLERLEEYPGICCSHMNTRSIHNHLVISAYSADRTAKMPMNKEFRQHLREISDEIALAYDIPIILAEKETSMSYYEWMQIQEGTSWKEQIRKDININMEMSRSWTEFVSNMEASGYMVKEGSNHVTYTTPEGHKSRDTNLGLEYQRDSIKQILGEPIEEKKTSVEIEVPNKKKSYTPTYKKKIYVSRYAESGRRRSKLERMLIMAIKVIQKCMDKFREDDNDTNIINKAASWKIDEMMYTLEYLQQNSIDSIEDILNEKQKVGKLLGEAKSTLKGLQNNLQSRGEFERIFADFEESQIIYDSIGFDDDKLYLNNYSEEQIRRKRAEVLPMLPDQKKKLFNIINNSDGKYKVKVGFQYISKTEADEIFAYIKDSTRPVPSVLIDRDKNQSDYLEDKYESLRQARIKNLKSKYGTEMMTPAQSKMLFVIAKQHPEINQVQINNNADASLVIQYFTAKNNYDSELANETELNNIQTILNLHNLTCTRDMLTKSDIKEIMDYLTKTEGKAPEEVARIYKPDILSDSPIISESRAGQIEELLSLKGEKISFPIYKLNEKEYNKLINYLINKGIKPDVLKTEAELQADKNKIKERGVTSEEIISNRTKFTNMLLDYAPDEAAQISAYRMKLDKCRELGINPKEIPSKLEEIRAVRALTKEQEKQVEELGNKYRELNRIENNIKLASNEAFLTGKKFKGTITYDEITEEVIIENNTPEENTKQNNKERDDKER